MADTYPLFSLGRFVGTPGAAEAASPEEMMSFLSRHQRGHILGAGKLPPL